MNDTDKKKLMNEILDITDGWAKHIFTLIKHREDYKTVGQYDKADETREVLKEFGIQINDTKDGIKVLELRK